MKKLMFAAAGAAVGLSAFAVLTPEVYEMNITLKTMTCKAGQGKNVCDDDYTTYRVKANQKIAGLFWGCDCPTIAEPKAFESFDDFGTASASHGYVFWDATDKTKPAYETACFEWTDAAGEFENFLQCVNPKCTEVEGVWTLQLQGMRKTDCDDPTADAELAPVVALQGAGIGSAKWNEDHLAAYINSMSGNVTGWAFPGILSGGCAACGEIWAGCSAWQFCTACEENDCNVPSAAYGTWTLKFNLTAAKKYGKGVSRDAILSAYKFSDKVKAYLIETHEGSDPEPVVDPCEDVNKAYDNALKAFNAAEAEYAIATDITKYTPYVEATNAAALAYIAVTNAMENDKACEAFFNFSYAQGEITVTSNEAAKAGVVITSDKLENYVAEYYRLMKEAQDNADAIAEEFAKKGSTVTEAQVKAAQKIADDKKVIFDLAWAKMKLGMTKAEQDNADKLVSDLAKADANIESLKAAEELAKKAAKDAKDAYDAKYTWQYQNECYANYTATKMALEVAKNNKTAAGCD